MTPRGSIPQLLSRQESASSSTSSLLESSPKEERRRHSAGTASSSSSSTYSSASSAAYPPTGGGERDERGGERHRGREEQREGGHRHRGEQERHHSHDHRRDSRREERHRERRERRDSRDSREGGEGGGGQRFAERKDSLGDKLGIPKALLLPDFGFGSNKENAEKAPPRSPGTPNAMEKALTAFGKGFGDWAGKMMPGSGGGNNGAKSESKVGESRGIVGNPKLLHNALATPPKDSRRPAGSRVEDNYAGYSPGYYSQPGPGGSSYPLPMQSQGGSSHHGGNKALAGGFGQHVLSSRGTPKR